MKKKKKKKKSSAAFNAGDEEGKLGADRKTVPGRSKKSFVSKETVKAAKSLVSEQTFKAPPPDSPPYNGASNSADSEDETSTSPSLFAEQEEEFDDSPSFRKEQDVSNTDMYTCRSKWYKDVCGEDAKKQLNADSWSSLRDESVFSLNTNLIFVPVLPLDAPVYTGGADELADTNYYLAWQQANKDILAALHLILCMRSVCRHTYICTKS